MSSSWPLRSAFFGAVLLYFGYFIQSDGALPLRGWWRDTWAARHHDSVSYEVQVFKADPLILYIPNFVSSSEITHILKNTEGRFEVSRVWPDEIGYIDKEVRISETAPLIRDEIVSKIEERASKFIGWRNNSTKLQRLKVQRYGFNGYYTFHYDWDGGSKEGNRMTTFMVYLNDDFTGGGTNFPKLEQPSDQRWCKAILCAGDEDYEDYPGVTFRPVAGSAVYWENFHPNGTPHTGTRHAGLPVRSGEKLGLNIWSWDSSWRPQDDKTE